VTAAGALRPRPHPSLASLALGGDHDRATRAADCRCVDSDRSGDALEVLAAPTKSSGQYCALTRGLHRQPRLGAKVLGGQPRGLPMSELMDAIREAIDPRKSEKPQATFDVGDLVARLPQLKILEAEKVKKTLRAIWKFSGLAPAAVDMGLWRFGDQRFCPLERRCA